MSKRAVAYVRVSKEREGMISPELQMTSIQSHCDKLGHSIVATLEDLDQSGRFWKSRQVDLAVQMIERREADVIVVWKISRVSRNMKDWVLAVDRVEGAGGHIESATEQFDATITGGFARGMMAQFADYESKRIGESWKETHARRVKNGLPHHGLPRFGYAYSKETGYTVDEVTGPVLREMYLRFIAGKNFHELGAYARSEGCEPESGWRTSTIRHMLDRGFGAGLLWSKGAHVPGAHEAVLSEAEWDAYRVKRQERASRASGGAHNTDEFAYGYAYSRLVRCHCGSRMDGSTIKRGENTFRRYTCRAAVEKKTHARVSISEPQVEAAVLEWLASKAPKVDAASKPVVPANNLERKQKSIASDLATTINRLIALTEKNLDGKISDEMYTVMSKKLESEKAALEARQRMLNVNATAKPRVFAPGLLADWPRMPARVKYETLSGGVARIQLHDWESPEKRGKRKLTVHEVWE